MKALTDLSPWGAGINDHGVGIGGVTSDELAELMSGVDMLGSQLESKGRKKGNGSRRGGEGRTQKLRAEGEENALPALAFREDAGNDGDELSSFSTFLFPHPRLLSSPPPPNTPPRPVCPSDARLTSSITHDAVLSTQIQLSFTPPIPPQTNKADPPSCPVHTSFTPSPPDRPPLFAARSTPRGRLKSV